MSVTYFSVNKTLSARVSPHYLLSLHGVTCDTEGGKPRKRHADEDSRGGTRGDVWLA